MPKGVYPRRPRAAKPVSVTKKQAPKQPDPRLKQTIWEYMDSDPEVVRLEDKRKELKELHDEARRSSINATHKVATYHRAIQVLQNQISAYECSSNEEEATVKEMTGEHLECIADSFVEVSKELYTSLVTQSREVVKHHDTAEELDQTRDELFKKWSAARTRARKEWEDHQAKLAKTAETK